MSSPPRSPRKMRVNVIDEKKSVLGKKLGKKKVVFVFGNEKLDISASVFAFYSITASDKLEDLPDLDEIEYNIKNTITNINADIVEAILKYLIYRYDHEADHKDLEIRTEVKDENDITSYSATEFLPEERAIIDKVSL